MKTLIILGLLLTSTNMFAGNVGESDSTCVDQVQSSRFSGDVTAQDQSSSESESEVAVDK
ncbi:hypothetical protein OAT67_00025 [Bacteriovoracaceae bacterium]|nr:hypothetical protein [Bacteriovoracaceae bacterium]|tara:strand:+ start:299356 stop:299535 length:180 start_codon:yes stop_codon:yes gene_type:complete